MMQEDNSATGTGLRGLALMAWGAKKMAFLTKKINPPYYFDLSEQPPHFYFSQINPPR